nr:MAG TPA: hypothetical protein [Caudoviricetes sp.]
MSSHLINIFMIFLSVWSSALYQEFLHSTEGHWRGKRRFFNVIG